MNLSVLLMWDGLIGKTYKDSFLLRLPHLEYYVPRV